MSIEKISATIRDVNDFPKKGIVFKDITPVIHDGKMFSEVIDIFQSMVQPDKPDYIVAIESRGFIFGSALADRLGCGIVPVRKKGKLPYRTIEESYDLEYGSATIEIHKDALKKGDKVILIDDLLATGGTASASVRLVEKLGAEICGIFFLVELKFCNGREKLASHPVKSLISFD